MLLASVQLNNFLAKFLGSLCEIVLEQDFTNKTELKK